MSESTSQCFFANQRYRYVDGFVREDRVDTRTVPDDQKFAFWHDNIKNIADVSLSDATGSGRDFRADARGYDLGKMAVLNLRTDAFEFRRDADLIKHSGLDHWVLTYRSLGHTVSRCGERVLHVEPKSLWLNSLAYPSDGRIGEGSTISLFIERDHLLPIANQLDRLNHTILHGITAQIAVQFLISMVRLLPSTPIGDIPIFVETAFIIMRGFAEHEGPADCPLSRPLMVVRLEMVKRYIQENLTSDRLEPDDICLAMKLSRRQLYYLFEEIGGVSAYVRSHRLAAVHAAISDPTETRPIHVLAAWFGFHDPALFSRQFKSQFGYSPKDAREGKYFEYLPLAQPPRSIWEWLGQVRDTQEI
ncbi:MAG: helix-turn-helix domain-containing protein [Mesorhizobium sp.]